MPRKPDCECGGNFAQEIRLFLTALAFDITVRDYPAGVVRYHRARIPLVVERWTWIARDARMRFDFSISDAAMNNWSDGWWLLLLREKPSGTRWVPIIGPSFVAQTPDKNVTMRTGGFWPDMGARRQMPFLLTTQNYMANRGFKWPYHHNQSRQQIPWTKNPALTLVPGAFNPPSKTPNPTSLATETEHGEVNPQTGETNRHRKRIGHFRRPKPLSWKSVHPASPWIEPDYPLSTLRSPV